MIVMIPYLKDIMSKSTLNQWSHAQQPTLIKGHLVIAHLKPKIYSTIMLNLKIKQAGNNKSDIGSGLNRSSKSQDTLETKAQY